MRASYYLLMLAAFATEPVSLGAQGARGLPAGDEATTIMIATTSHLRAKLPLGSMMIEVADSSAMGIARAKAIAAAVNGRPGPANRQCRGTTPDTCHLVGAQSAIRLMAPVITGDAAAIQVQLLQETDNVNQPIFSSEQLVRLVRRGGKWVVLGSRLRRAS